MKQIFRKIVLGALSSLFVLQACQTPNVNTNINKNTFTTKSNISELQIPFSSIPYNYTDSTFVLVQHVYSGEAIYKQGANFYSTLNINKDINGRIYINAWNQGSSLNTYLPQSVSSLKTGDVINFTINPENSLPIESSGSICQNLTGVSSFYLTYSGYNNYISPLTGAKFQLSVLEDKITINLLDPLMDLPVYSQNNCVTDANHTFNIFNLDSTFTRPAPTPSSSPTATPTITPTIEPTPPEPTIPPTTNDCSQKSINDFNKNVDDTFDALNKLNYLFSLVSSNSGFKTKAYYNSQMYDQGAYNFALDIQQRTAEVKAMENSAIAEERELYTQRDLEAGKIIASSLLVAGTAGMSAVPGFLMQLAATSPEVFFLATQSPQVLAALNRAAALIAALKILKSGDSCLTPALASGVDNSKSAVTSIDDFLNGIYKATGKAGRTSAGDLFEQKAINAFSGKIIRTNEQIYNKAGKVIGEIDFETSDAIGEVGLSIKGKLSQLHKLAEIAKDRSKKLIVVYGPDTKLGTVQTYSESLSKKWGTRVEFVPFQ